MKGKKPKKRKMSFENKIALMDIFLSAVAVLQSFGDREISQKHFAVLMSGMVLICIIVIVGIVEKIWEERKEYVAKRIKLEKEAERDNEKKKAYAYEKKEIVEDFFARCLFTIYKQRKVLAAIIVSVIIICVCNPNNAYVYWESILELAGIREIDIASVSEEAEVPEYEEETLQNERNMAWRFVLDDFNYVFVLDDEREKQVFFCSDEPYSEHIGEIRESIVQWQMYPKTGVNYAQVKDGLGNDYFTYTEQEDSFKNAVKQASQYIYLEDWLDFAPHSSEKDIYIQGRENLNKVEVEGEMGCYEIWWLLANDYQYYAQEYEIQTENKDAILYYYVNSIYCCMEALKYSISEEEYVRTYHYMVTRYHDMFRKESRISQEYKEKAYKIYLILVESDSLSKENINIQH